MRKVEILWNYWPFSDLVWWPIKNVLNLLFFPFQFFLWPTQVIWNFVPYQFEASIYVLSLLPFASWIFFYIANLPFYFLVGLIIFTVVFGPGLALYTMFAAIGALIVA
jgi:hypothetical protein